MGNIDFFIEVARTTKREVEINKAIERKNKNDRVMNLRKGA